MAHFAELDENNVVLRVIVVANSDNVVDGEEHEAVGAAFCSGLLAGRWVQTSYNGSIRKNFAGPGFRFDENLNAFIPPKPYESWLLDNETCRWVAPSPEPDDGATYFWDEESKAWMPVLPS